MCRWEPEETPWGVVQIVHGIAEHVRCYDDFARYLNSFGYLVVAEDHMGHGKSIGTNGKWVTSTADGFLPWKILILCAKAQRQSFRSG